ncbi:hypothetical protein CSUNSWCD_416 [Campylobacter showae CSUNSWCD]|uniref:Uncharacterized protein n=1 Tax=Campylobacter showae CSUNSWCD TaxID=1244083 RepID=M5ISG8_9BACT|nr:hypothetical protein CSUNSWCD_416 [Campylobacter showae CSUNSWCD]
MDKIYQKQMPLVKVRERVSYAFVPILEVKFGLLLCLIHAFN